MLVFRSAEEMFLSVGGRIGYFQGDPRKLVDDIGELRPTIFIGALLAGVLEVAVDPIAWMHASRLRRSVWLCSHCKGQSEG